MRDAIRFYGHVHREFWWLNLGMIVFLILTSVYWFITPYYIVNYGGFEPTFFVKCLIVVVICILPAIVVTSHCWIISFVAARKWRAQTKRVGESMLRWWFVFQSVTVSIAVVFSATIFTLFIIIDFLRMLI